MTMPASCSGLGADKRLPTAGARGRIADFWDDLTAAWLAGEDPLPCRLPEWYESYEGRGDGQPTREAFAEPYVGDLRGTPRMVTLGLNPGQACLDFQSRSGIFAREIRERGSYSAWAATSPYFGEEWLRVNGRNRYASSRLRFAREWLEDQEFAADQMLTLELYPWHSTRLTAPIRPSPEIIETFVWEPVADMQQVEFVFAFGKPWLGVCEALGLREVGRWGHGGVDLGSPVASRAVVAFALPSGQWVVVSWQSGYAGPPGREDALRIRDRLLDARRRRGVRLNMRAGPAARMTPAGPAEAPVIRAACEEDAASGKSKRRLVSEAVREHLTDDGLVVGHAALRETGDEVMTAGETAALLKLDEPAVLAAAQGGELPGRRIGSHWRFSRGAIMAWLAGDAHVERPPGEPGDS
jgi:excisionase family DNA binding protein